ncbi:MAG: iron-regulated protein FrpC, partial [Bacteroidota bacterium]
SDPATVLLDWTIPITADTTVWVYDEVFSEPEICTTEFSFDINVNGDPIANPVPAQIVCDDATNDGIGVFDLDSLVATILGAQPAAAYTITFHETALDATDGTNAIPNTAAFNAPAGSIFARIENNLSAICFDTTEITLVVDDQPIANPVPPLVVCDDDTNDGVEIFDLTATEPTVLGGQNAADYDITFHPDLASAQAGTGALTGVNAISLMNGDSVFVRIENDGNSDCFDTTEITITIDLQPLATDPGEYGICDDTSDGDDANGFTEFMLTSRDTFILNGQDPTQFTVSYHTSLADAQNDANPLPALYTNTSINSELIHARVENNSNSDCFALTNFEIVVYPLPVILNNPALLTQCDDDTDGFAFFNLTQAEPLLSADFGNETFTYSDAGGAPIVDPVNYV